MEHNGNKIHRVNNLPLASYNTSAPRINFGCKLNTDASQTPHVNPTTWQETRTRPLKKRHTAKLTNMKLYNSCSNKKQSKPIEL